MKNLFIRFAMAALITAPLAGLFPLSASADSLSVNFEIPTYAVGSINGQDGWLKTGNYDANVMLTGGTPASFGAQTLQISDAVTSGSFGDQTFAKPLTDSVGETGATNGTFSAGTKQSHYEMQFDFASAISDALQTGMHLSVSPDRGDGSRMSYLRFEDQSDGIHVFFDDVTDVGPVGTVATFNESDIATMTRTAHTIKLTMDTPDGPANDVVKVYFDGVLKKTGTSWEDYYRFDPEAVGEQSPRIVKTVEFRESGTANAADAGKGFLIDNFSQSAGPAPVSTVSVHIFKNIDGTQATVANANSYAFPMLTTFNSSNLGSAVDAPFTLSPTGWGSGDAAYEASFANSNPGADYATHEVTGGSVVGTDCSAGAPYALVGYTSGDTLAAAQAATPTAAAPSFTGLSSDKYVIVWNKMCLPAPVITTPANNTVTNTAGLPLVDWTDVTDPAGGITYTYQAANSPATNGDGSFTSAIYSQSGLSASQIPTPGTPDGVYYLQVQAKDADGNVSPWSATVKVTIDNTPPPALLKVHILKYLDGVKAATVVGNYQFPMTATWQTANLNGGAQTSGNYTLGNNFGGAADLYGADTAAMQAPADYSTSEITDNTSSVVAAPELCTPRKFLLNGYRVSATNFTDAANQPLVPTASFTGLTGDEYVIVDNSNCPTTGSLTVNKVSVGGNATFNFTGDNGIGKFSITTAGNTGYVTFNNLAPGTYHITETAKSGWTQTDSDCAAVTVNAGSAPVCTITNTNNRLLGVISGTKFEDRDGDGKLKDGDHHRLAGVTIYLDTNNNGSLNSGEPSTVTDSHGNYSFVGLPAGTYHVREMVPAGWTQTVPASGKYDIALTAGQVAKNKNFGDFKPGTISGMKFNDLNGNHRKDANEPGLAGVIWNLTTATGLAK